MTLPGQIVPGQIYQDVTYIDADGDTVQVQITGPVTDIATQGFTIQMAGLAANNADASTIKLVGLNEANGLQVVVTPNEVENAGPNFNKMWSAGYTSIAFIKAEKAGAGKIDSIGGIQLSAALVNKIDLAGVSIVDNITLDAGQAPYIDRVNTTNNAQATDSTKYEPVTGLIDIGGIEAANIGSLVINGAVGFLPTSPYDLSQTNDFKSVINVSGRIESVIGLRSCLAGAIRANSIGSVRVVAITGEISTKDVTESLSINLPAQFKGFINSAGHLNLGFPLSGGALITGQISAGGGISGSDKALDDTIFIPDAFLNSLTNTSNQVGIANISVDGIAQVKLFSNSTIGNIDANSFGAGLVVESKKSIGNITAGSGGVEGHLQAGTDIGNIKAEAAIMCTMIAGGNIGAMTSVTMNLMSLSIQARGNIGAMSLYTGMTGTSIIAGGDLGSIIIPTFGITGSYLRANNIGNIEVVDGSINTTSLIALNDIADITAFASFLPLGIFDVTMTSGRDIGAIDGRTHTGFGMAIVNIEAGRNIKSISGISYGTYDYIDQFDPLDPLNPNNVGIFGAGIILSTFVGKNIGPVLGRSIGGTGIWSSKVITSTVMDINGNVDKTSGRIDSISGIGWADGLKEVIAVAHTSIGAITGNSIVSGNGINQGSYDANYGKIGQIIAEGGAAGGSGIVSTRFQSTDKSDGGIDGITTSANANGDFALNDTNIYASKIGNIVAVVHGGLSGTAISVSNIQTFWGSIASINIDTRSINGYGIQDSTVKTSSDNNGNGLGSLRVVSLNNTAILNTTFETRGNFGPIYAEAKKNGNAIEGSTFKAPGRIFYSPQETLINPPGENPFGNFSTITAIASGTNNQSNAILDSTFTAIGSIGLITAQSKGAGSIVGSKFTADSDDDYLPSDPTRPGETTGNITGIAVTASGRNLGDSSGIVNSDFSAANIGPVDVSVQTVEGGDAIRGSTFTAVTAVYDNKGNYNNTGSIGNVTVASDSSSFNGISSSTFDAGSAGSIGKIDVTLQGNSLINSGGVGILNSEFRAINSDKDQDLFSSKIGEIKVTAGRKADFTGNTAAIDGSTFRSNAGIDSILVNSIGTAINSSTFNSDDDFGQIGDINGPIGAITVNVPGRNASGVIDSTFTGGNIGDIDIQLANDAKTADDAVSGSKFHAVRSFIGNIKVVNTGPIEAQRGYAVLNSTFEAQSSIGSITVQGRMSGAQFIANGQPIIAASFRAAASTAPNSGIGPITIVPIGSMDVTFTANGSIGDTIINNAQNGSNVKLTINAPNVGSVVVASPGSGVANLNLTTSATNIGNISADGNAVINGASIGRMGNLSVGGQLSIPQGLPKMSLMGTFTAGSLAALNKAVMIGSKQSISSSIGKIQIGNMAKGKAEYQFAFGSYLGTPNATIGGKSGTAKSGNGLLLNGARLILNAGAKISSKSASKKS